MHPTLYTPQLDAAIQQRRANQPALRPIRARSDGGAAGLGQRRLYDRLLLNGGGVPDAHGAIIRACHGLCREQGKSNTWALPVGASSHASGRGTKTQQGEEQ